MHLLVSHLIDSDAHVSWIARTRVHVAVVFWYEVDVVKDDAVEAVAFQRFDERYVHETSFVERVIASLWQRETTQQ